MLNLRTKFHVRISNALLVIAIKFKTKENFRTAAILLHYSLQKKSP
jgi:hypothetical protein